MEYLKGLLSVHNTPGQWLRPAAAARLLDPVCTERHRYTQTLENKQQSRRINGLSTHVDDFERRDDVEGGGRCRAIALSAGGSVFSDLKQGDFAGAVHA